MENIFVYNTGVTGQSASTNTRDQYLLRTLDDVTHTGTEQTTLSMERHMDLGKCPFLWEEGGREYISDTFGKQGVKFSGPSSLMCG